MADAINRTTLEVVTSINTPDFSEEQWIINPNLSSVVSVDKKYWKIVGDAVQEMNASEKEAVDTAGLSDYLSGVMEAAIYFGRELIKDAAVHNILAGYSTAQIKAIADYLTEIQGYLESGSLKVAKQELLNLSPLVVDNVTLVSQDTIDEFIGKINTYLGV